MNYRRFIQKRLIAVEFFEISIAVNQLIRYTVKCIQILDFSKVPTKISHHEKTLQEGIAWCKGDIRRVNEGLSGTPYKRARV